jgi:uncharacterized membrane protein
MLDHYGEPHGIKIARKHVGWAIERWCDAGLIEVDQARHMAKRAAALS